MYSACRGRLSIRDSSDRQPPEVRRCRSNRLDRPDAVPPEIQTHQLGQSRDRTPGFERAGLPNVSKGGPSLRLALRFPVEEVRRNDISAREPFLGDVGPISSAPFHESVQDRRAMVDAQKSSGMLRCGRRDRTFSRIGRTRLAIHATRI